MRSQTALLTVLLNQAAFDVRLEGIGKFLNLSACQGASLKSGKNLSFTGTLGVVFGERRCRGESEKLLVIL